MPRVSIVMPLYNGKRFIRESIESILAQTFTDWEFLIINEFGSDDGCAFIVKKYAEKDSRIKLIQNDVRLGLAASLNVGLDLAIGEYVARVDVDDPSYPDRLDKQVSFLDMNRTISLCSVLQRSVTQKSKTVQLVNTSREHLKADMLFGCEISHCGVMLRKKIFDDRNYRYNPSFLSEDYELWMRIIKDVPMEILPEVLVDHRWGFGNISIEKGDSLKREISEISARSIFDIYSISVPLNDLPILSGWRSMPKEYASLNKSDFLKKTYLLLESMRNKNNENSFLTSEAMNELQLKRFNWAFDVCDIKYDKHIEQHFYTEKIESSTISIIVYILNCYENLRECLDSLVRQTFHNFEVLLIHEYGSDDSSREICEFYCKYDKRFKLLQNQQHLGIAKSINLGIQESTSKYIAHMDSDCVCKETRLETQFNYMEKNSKIGVCGSYQNKFRSEICLHSPPMESSQIKANLLFYNDLIHSTLMIRKSVINEHDLSYNSTYYNEDYEFLCRIVKYTEFHTIPEGLVFSRGTGRKIDYQNQNLLQKENAELVAESLKCHLNLELNEKQVYLLNACGKPFFDSLSLQEREEALNTLKDIFIEIYQSNKKIKFYEEKSLLCILGAKWRFAKYNKSCYDLIDISSLDEVFTDHEKQNKIKLKWKLKSDIKKFFLPRLKSIFNVISEYSIINKFVERWTWERYNRTKNDLKSIDAKIDSLLTESSYNKNLNMRDLEKIKVTFLFQIPSFWPSWETFYNACEEDPNLDVDIVLLETNKEPSQMYGAKSFLESNGLVYKNYSDYEFVPGQILVIQSPYDNWHRNPENSSIAFKRLGIKVVYVTYGIEISDTSESNKLHFHESVLEHSWRIYTFSNLMLSDYKQHCRNHLAARSVGHPKFDCYFKEKLQFPCDLKDIIQTRKIVLFKLHFPKYMKIKSEEKLTTIPLSECLQFSKYIKERSDIFFICQLHPKFFDYDKPTTTTLLHQLLQNENLYIDRENDYRTSLMNADYIIIDRSAVMVEAGAVGVPVLYLSNPDYYEPMTKAVEPLVASYYQGNCCQDMIDFIEMCVDKGEDPRKEKRESAFRECVPYFDGKCGERIKEDIISSLEKESELDNTKTLMRLEGKIDRLENILEEILLEHKGEK